VNYHNLLGKIVKVLEEIYAYLNNRAYTSNSDFTKRKFFNTTIAMVALVRISGFMLVQVMAAIQLSSTISTIGTLNLSTGIGLY
jgi:hypothetical protein